MASVFSKGPASAPRWFACYRDASGRRVRRRVRQQTRRDALKVANALEAREERIRFGLEAPPPRGEPCGKLLRKWGAGLTNRARETDLCRIDRHLVPAWKNVLVTDVDVPAILRWLDRMRAARKIGPATQRHCFATLSRFLSWCVARALVPRNVARDVPAGSLPRPIAPPPESIPWLADDDQVVAIMRALPAPLDAVFFVGNRSGARLSEILSLRLADLDRIDERAIRIRYAGEDGTGCLKEEKHGSRGGKPAPIPAADARVVLGPILAARRLAGAGPEDFVFVDQDGDRIDRHAVGHRWRQMRRRLGLPAGLNFYRATRHSAASRALAAGAALAEISASLGHASEATTRAHYLHHVRRTFSPILTAGLGVERLAKVIALPAPEAERGPVQPGKGDADAA